MPAGCMALSEAPHCQGQLDSRKSLSLSPLHWVTLSELPKHCLLSLLRLILLGTLATGSRGRPKQEHPAPISYTRWKPVCRAREPTGVAPISVSSRSCLFSLSTFAYQAQNFTEGVPSLVCLSAIPKRVWSSSGFFFSVQYDL